LENDDAERLQYRHQTWDRDLSLVVLGQDKPAQFRPEVPANAVRQWRCQHAAEAVGSSGDPDSLYLVIDAFCSGDNNENNKTKRDGGSAIAGTSTSIL
jgi:hypothetical protein